MIHAFATVSSEEDVSGAMDLLLLYDLLDQHFDVQEWWPSSSAFEIMVGAILTQQTNWQNVLRALEGLRSRGLLHPGVLGKIDPQSLEDIIRPCGFYRQKSRRIVLMAAHIQREYGGDPRLLFERDLPSVRKELLSLEGVGKETADSILLFAASKPRFVGAAYVARVLRRTGLLESGAYDDVQEFVESGFFTDPEHLARLYALFVELAKNYCRPRPLCDECPLGDHCIKDLRA